jgi:hypothetical protein
MSAERGWAGTFAHFRPGRMPVLGPIAIRVADWFRPQRGETPMFAQVAMEESAEDNGRDAAPGRHFGVSSPLWDVVFRTR